MDHNRVAGNLSTGVGGCVVHSGLSFNGTIDHNYILFNQSTDATLPTNGGGLGMIGANGTRTLANGNECNSAEVLDCPPGLGDGTGANLMIDSNLFFFSSRRRHTRCGRDWSSDVCSSDLCAGSTSPTCRRD